MDFLCKEYIYNIVNFVKNHAASKVHRVINDNSDTSACFFSLKPETFIEDMNHNCNASDTRDVVKRDIHFIPLKELFLATYLLVHLRRHFFYYLQLPSASFLAYIFICSQIDLVYLNSGLGFWTASTITSSHQPAARCSVQKC